MSAGELHNDEVNRPYSVRLDAGLGRCQQN